MIAAMKKIKYIIIAIACSMLFLSCDDMLDLTPKSKMTPETFFKNDSEMMAFAMNLYSMFPNADLYKENTDTYTQTLTTDELRGIRPVPASGGGWSWGALRNVNTLLDYLPNCKDAQTRIKFEAIARFFRAYFYSEKVKRFGDVPWYDSQVGSTETEKLNRPRDSREFILGKMIEDIDFAIDNLPSTKSAYELTKWSAMALKSRFLLFEGTFRKYHTEFDYGSDAHDYKWYLDLCAETSATLMASSGYSLHTTGGANASYLELFTTDNATDLMDEVILARDFNDTYNVTHNAACVVISGSNGQMGMTKKLVASYLCKDGSRFTDKAGWQTMQFADECKDRDPRLAQSIRTPGYHRIGQATELAPDLTATMTGYQPIKYVTTAEYDGYNKSVIDLIIFRYAEVLLNYAEAKAEAGTLTQDDLEISINRLRDRVGMPHLELTAANANPDPFLTDASWGGYQNVTGANKGVILEIRRERTIELCQEGFRYYDIMRWKEGKIFEKQFYGLYFPGVGEYDIDGNGSIDLLLYTGDTKPESSATMSYCLLKDLTLSSGTSGFFNPHADETRKWNDGKDYLYPIPSDERLLTNGALAQNPGWNDGLNF